MRRLYVLLVMAAGLALGSASASADGKSAIDTFVATACPQCNAWAAKLTNQVQTLSPPAAPLPPGSEIAKHVDEGKTMLALIGKVQQGPAAANGNVADYKRVVDTVTHLAPLLERRLDRDLGVPASGALDHARDLISSKINWDEFSRFGKGAPSAMPAYDGSVPREAIREVIPVSPTVTMVVDAPVTVADLLRRTDDWMRIYKSTPQGVVLEDAVAGLSTYRTITYDPSLHALAFDDKAVYFLKTAPKTAAVLAWAIATDKDQHGNPERIGVSIGRTFITYGALPKDSDVAQQLFLTDRFLGDIVFGERRWTGAYRFAGNFQPQAGTDSDDRAAVAFRFFGFKVKVDDGIVRPVSDSIEITVYPTSPIPAKDGGGQPDTAAIKAGKHYVAFEANARHIMANEQDHASGWAFNR